MATENAFGCMGTSALAQQNPMHLRLVYDSRFDESRQHANTASKQTTVTPTLAVAAIVTLLVVCALTLFVSSVRDASLGSKTGAVSTQTVRVASGDTLWSIAEGHSIEGVSTYDVVQWIKNRNDLQKSSLAPGTELTVPA